MGNTIDRPPAIQIFVMTHNRPEYVQDCVRSVLAQDFDDFELILSDNSSHGDNRTEELFKNFSHPKFRYVRRTPSSQQGHYIKMIDDINAEFVMLFHDDDIMLPGMISSLVKILRDDSGLAAAASNYYKLLDGKPSCQPEFPASDKLLAINSPTELLLSYFSSGSIAANPSYMYRYDAIANPGFRDYIGKYNDVAQFIHIVKCGRIAWTMQPLMLYRIHASQDSSSISPYQFSKLRRYIRRNVDDFPEALLYRVQKGVWCGWLKTSFKISMKKHPRRWMKVFIIMLPYLLLNKCKQLLRWSRGRRGHS